MIDVVLDPGHGGKDTGVIGGTGLKEKECSLIIAKRCGEYLKEKKIEVKYTRDDDEFISIENRIRIANTSGAKLFVSIHINSVNDKRIKGCEAYTLRKGTEGEILARNIINSITTNTALEDRGTKFANFTILKDIKVPSALVEVCYISNAIEESLLKDDDFKRKLGVAIGKGIISYINNDIIEDENEIRDYNIIAQETAIESQAMQWAKDNKATEEFIALAKVYWSLNEKLGGVNPVIAYAQAAYESGFGHYSEGLDATFKNPCALRKNGCNDESKEAYIRFDTWNQGVSAHLEHLALYGGAEGYPKGDACDQRHFSFLKGRAKKILELSGNWSPIRTYGENILKYVEEINEMIVREKFQDFNIEESVKEKVNIKDKKLEERNYNKLKSVKNDVVELYQILSRLKEKVDSINKTLGNIENDLGNGSVQNEELIIKNKALSEKISNYENAISSVLNVLSDNK